MQAQAVAAGKPSLPGGLRGDIYEIVEGGPVNFALTPRGEGVKFQTVLHRAFFKDYAKGSPDVLALDDVTAEMGYYLITAVGNNTKTVLGLFIPTGRKSRDRKPVANNVRQAFGPQSQLRKAPRCENCGKGMDRLKDGSRCCDQCG